jgi:hypothetical protein
MYNLMLGLPFKVKTDQIKSYFDCKIRRLFVHARRLSEQPASAPADQEAADEPEEANVKLSNEPAKESKIAREDSRVEPA